MLKLSIAGDKELVDKLKEFTKAETKSAMQTGAKKALEPVQKTARAIAPKKTGRLRKAIRIRVLKRSRRRVGARVTVGSQDSMFKGRTFYGAFQEYGWRVGRRASNADLGIRKRKRRTAAQAEQIAELNNARKKIDGQRYMRRAVDSNREIVMTTFRGLLREGIQKVMKKKMSKKLLPVLR